MTGYIQQKRTCYRLVLAGKVTVWEFLSQAMAYAYSQGAIEVDFEERK